jgi:hypothetical protein
MIMTKVEGIFLNPQLVLNDFGYAQGWQVDKHPRFLADLTGNGKSDIIGFGNDGVHMALNNGDGTFQPSKLVLHEFDYEAGGWRVEMHPRFLADLTGDGCADIIGFGYGGFYVTLNNGDETFKSSVFYNEFGYYDNAGGWRVDRHPRFLADLTGDGKADIIGFGEAGVYVALNNGNGTFQPSKLVLNDFCYAQGWQVDKHPRFLAELTGDGKADIIGFGEAGVYVALNNGDGTFQPSKLILNDFGYAQGWQVDKYPRFLADLTGDGMVEIIGFGEAGVYVSKNYIQYALTNLQENLLAYYPLKNDTNDYSENGHNGTSSLNVKYSPGKWGDAADFTTSGAYIELPDMGRNSNEYTISLWIYLNSYSNIDNNASEWGTIIGQLSVSHVDGCLAFNFGYDSPDVSNNKVIKLLSNGRLSPAVWHHVLVTYDHESRQFDFYIDGRVDSTFDLKNQVALTDCPNLPIYPLIGGTYKGVSGTSTLNGLLGDVFIFTTNVNQDEINILANVVDETTNQAIQKRSLFLVGLVIVAFVFIATSAVLLIKILKGRLPKTWDKTVTVLVWGKRIKERNVGHAALLLPDTTYISWWPADEKALITNRTVPAVPNRKYEDDLIAEGHGKKKEPDKKILINTLNCSNIKEWWDKFRNDKNSMYNLYGQNCSKTVYDALCSGGALSVLTEKEKKRYSASGLWTPGWIQELAETLEKHNQKTDL